MAKEVQPNPVLAAFERMRRGLKLMATRLTGDDADAEDALQEAFVRLWVKRRDIASADQAAAIMTATVRNLSIDTLRQRSRLPAVSLDEERDEATDTEADERAAADERFAQVEAIIDERLTPTQRAVLRMRDYEGLPFETIAEQLGMQPTAVRMQLSRARKAVRDIYREQQTH